MQQTADLRADATIKFIFATNGINGVNALWIHLLTNEDLVPPDAPAELRDYFDKTGSLPSWTDKELIARAEDFFEQYGPYYLVSLLAASLPECYALKNEAAVLGTTRELEQHAYRRVFETTQLVVDVMRQEGLCSGRGVRAAQKVRLMHAAIRHLILNTASGKREVAPKSFTDAIAQMPPWDVAASGQPINQELIAYTLLTFSFTALRSLEKLKFSLCEEDELAVLHCWNVVGAVMGLDERMMAFTFEDAQFLFEKIKKRHLASSEDGQHLTRALLTCSRKIIDHETEGLVPSFLTRRFPAAVTRVLLDKATRKALKIPWLGPLEFLMFWFLRLLALVSKRAYSWLLTLTGLRFGQAIVLHLTKLPRGNRLLFAIPDHLADAWKISRPRF